MTGMVWVEREELTSTIYPCDGADATVLGEIQGQMGIDYGLVWSAQYEQMSLVVPTRVLNDWLNA